MCQTLTLPRQKQKREIFFRQKPRGSTTLPYAQGVDQYGNHSLRPRSFERQRKRGLCAPLPTLWPMPDQRPGYSLAAIVLLAFRSGFSR